MKHINIILVIGLLVTLGACETRTRQTLTPDFGDSVRHNMAVQIINPAASEQRTSVIDMDGERAAGAMDRYRKGTVTAPKAESTSGIKN